MVENSHKKKSVIEKKKKENERYAQALRDNLKRRKAQMNTRSSSQ